MHVDVCHPNELGAHEVDRWRALQSSDPAWANPFLSATFARTVGECRRDARVAVVSDGGRITGFLPFQRGVGGDGRAIGFGVSDLQAFVHEPDADWCPTDLLRGCGLHIWEYDHLVVGADDQVHRRVAPASVMDVRAGYEAYLAEGGRKDRRSVRSALQKRRKLAREVGDVELELTSPTSSDLALLMGWKSAQYRRTGRRDRFARPWIRELVERLAVTAEPDCSGLLSVLRAGGTTVAAHFGVRAGANLSMWFPAYDLMVGRYSPGLLLFLGVAEAGAGDGIGLLDLGKGDEDYKQSLRSWTYPVAEGVLHRRSPLAAVHLARRAPSRVAHDVVLRSPSLRRSARAALSRLGQVRHRS